MKCGGAPAMASLILGQLGSQPSAPGRTTRSMSAATWADWLAFANDAAHAADLDDDVRRAVATDLAVGNAEWAIFDAVIGTRKPLPAPMLQRIRDDVLPMKWYDDADDLSLFVDALGR